MIDGVLDALEDMIDRTDKNIVLLQASDDPEKKRLLAEYQNLRARQQVALQRFAKSLEAKP